MKDIVDISRELENNSPNENNLVLLGELLQETSITEHDIEFLLVKYCFDEYANEDRKAIAKSLYAKQTYIQRAKVMDKNYKKALLGDRKSRVSVQKRRLNKSMLKGSMKPKNNKI